MAELEMDRGEDREAVFTWGGDSVFEEGDIVRFTVKQRLTDPDSMALVAVTSAGGGVSLSDTKAIVEIPAAATATLTRITRLHYDWQLTTPNGKTRTLDKGTILVSLDVTQTIP
jgi:hypothetical protein